MMKARTPEEMKAYIDGYNACFKTFMEYLKYESVGDAVDRMKIITAAVNGVVERSENEHI